ncbi:Hypothetical predicted protein, partial [Paramuricea clavata]
APATAFFNRQLRTKLPDVHTNARDPAEIQETDQKAKRKMKKYADSKAYVKPSRVRPGDTVVLKRDPSHRKSETPYEPKPYKVVSCKGSMVTATRGEKTVTRNSSFFKLVRQQDEPTEGNSTDGEYDNLEDTDGETDNIAQAKEQQQEPHRYPQRVRAPPRHLADYA